MCEGLWLYSGQILAGRRVCFSEVVHQEPLHHGESSRAPLVTTGCDKCRGCSYELITIHRRVFFWMCRSVAQAVQDRSLSARSVKPSWQSKHAQKQSPDQYVSLPRVCLLASNRRLTELQLPQRAAVPRELRCTIKFPQTLKLRRTFRETWVVATETNGGLERIAHGFVYELLYLVPASNLLFELVCQGCSGCTCSCAFAPLAVACCLLRK